MKVLLISSNSSPRGGGEKYLVFMASGLLARGCSVDVLLSDANYMDGWAADLCKCGASVHRLGLVGLRDRKLRFLQSMFAFGQQRKIAAFCRELAPDYILVNQQYDGVCPVSPMVKENIGDRVLKRLEQEKVMPSGV